KGYPGMPEVGNLPVPHHLLERGITDLVRISDARMSGTAFGTVVLHVAPEAAVGGPLALVRTGDVIELDVPNRSLQMLVSPETLSERKASLVNRDYSDKRGWERIYLEHVNQADQ